MGTAKNKVKEQNDNAVVSLWEKMPASQFHNEVKNKLKNNTVKAEFKQISSALQNLKAQGRKSGRNQRHNMKAGAGDHVNQDR